MALEWDPNKKGAYSNCQLVSEWLLSLDASFHSERLLWGVHQVLESSRWKLEDLDALGVGVGPGSFTGLRIGVTTARTLAGIMKKPLLGVSSLAALARPAALSMAETHKNTIIIAATDACKGELFAVVGAAPAVSECVCMASGDVPGLWKRGVEEKVYSPEELIALVQRKLAQNKTAKWLVVGEGRSRYTDVWKKLPAAREAQPVFPFPDQIQGRYLGMLAWEAFQAGLLQEPLSVEPRYLRASDAEIKLAAGLLPPGPKRDS